MAESPHYRPTSFERSREEEKFQAFTAEVLTVDVDRKSITIQDTRTGLPYYGIKQFPASASSSDGTSVDMPERGSRCACLQLSYNSGFSQPIIVAWLVSDTNRAQQGIAIRSIDNPGHPIQGLSNRVRGNYRKAYPGQRTVANSAGYTERVDDGWDRQAADFSRDTLDPERRTWTRVTSREVVRTESHTVVSGPIERPGASNIASEALPDGTTRQVLYLAPGASPSDRYVSGKPDVIPVVEHAQKIQEYALDFPIPAEAIGTSLLDTILGTTADPWARTTVAQTGGVSFDNQSFPATQTWDHPYDTGKKAIGPTLNDGPTPQRRGFIIERSEGTLVGSNVFDLGTYGQILKPVLFPYTSAGRFATDVTSAYNPVIDSPDHVEARVAASAHSTRFTHEGNTTRWDITKEGMLSMEIGSTLPSENIPLSGQGVRTGYEHPHGAGRSIEAHTVGSVKLVIGKNRDEEESLDLQTLGQTVLRLGADDTSLPNQRRGVQTQLRGQKDVPGPRTAQYWTKANRKLTGLGDPGNLDAKVAGEGVSLRGALDGGLIMRVGARAPNALRRHLKNGYQDGPGVNPWSIDDPNRIDSRSPGRPTYGAGDAAYRFHDLTQAGAPQQPNPQLPYYWSGSPIQNMDQHGLSLDLHTVRDALVRVGKNPNSGQSLLMDLAGGIVQCIGADNQGRSITAALDGGIEMTIGPNKQGKGLRLEIRGDVDWTVYGNYHLNVTGDYVVNGTTISHTAKTDILSAAQNQYHMALGQIVHEAPELYGNQGGSVTSPTGTA